MGGGVAPVLDRRVRGEGEAEVREPAARARQHRGRVEEHGVGHHPGAGVEDEPHHPGPGRGGSVRRSRERASSPKPGKPRPQRDAEHQRRRGRGEEQPAPVREATASAGTDATRAPRPGARSGCSGNSCSRGCRRAGRRTAPAPARRGPASGAAPPERSARRVLPPSCGGPRTSQRRDHRHRRVDGPAVAAVAEQVREHLEELVPVLLEGLVGEVRRREQRPPRLPRRARLDLGGLPEPAADPDEEERHAGEDAEHRRAPRAEPADQGPSSSGRAW